MKNFIKNVLANMVAIIILCFIAFAFFIAIIAFSISGSSSKSKVTENSILTLTSKTHIIDSPLEGNESFQNLKDDINHIMTLDILEAIKRAKTDNNIKGISIENDFVSAGITHIDDIREALEDFKASGKFVLAYGNDVSQLSYYLSSVAQQYYLHPAGGIDLKGFSSEIVFLKDFSEKYGINNQVLRYGKYKAAVEPFLRNNLSPENKEQISTLINDIWGNTSQKIAASRKINIDEFQNIVDSLYSIIPDNNIKYKLADKLIQKSEYDNILREKLKIKKEDKLNKISFADYIENHTAESNQDKIGVLYASGAIYNGEGYDGVYSETFIKDIKKLATDDNVKAVVLRVNSPGGSANASDEILFELSELKKKKPLIVSFGDYAASGGYYISMAADKIYSEQNTITGSIGVFGVVRNLKGLANKNGINSESVNTNANSNMYSIINGLSSGGEAILTKSIEQTYKRFVHFVSKNRKQSFEQIDAIGEGRVWSGVKAKEIGLVDELGSLQDALKYAAEKAKLQKYELVSYPKKRSLMEQILGGASEEEISARLIKSKIGKENYEIYQQIVNPNIKNQILMESPYKINF